MLQFKFIIVVLVFKLNLSINYARLISDSTFNIGAVINSFS